MIDVEKALAGSVPLGDLRVIFAEEIQFHKLVLSQTVNRLISVRFIFTHVAVPGFSELRELFSLDLLHIDELLILALFHAAHLACVLNLGEQCNLLLATFSFEIVKFAMALIKVVLQHFEELDDLGIGCAIDILTREHRPILFKQLSHSRGVKIILGKIWWFQALRAALGHQCLSTFRSLVIRLFFDNATLTIREHGLISAFVLKGPECTDELTETDRS